MFFYKRGIYEVKEIIFFTLILFSSSLFSQKKTEKSDKDKKEKTYSDIITEKAVTDPGLFDVHKVDGKYYYEINDSLLDRDMLMVTRIAKMAKEMIEKNKIQKEVEIVGDIQKSLLSKNKKEDFPIAGINIPAKVVSGDFYNFSDLGDGKYGFGVADVSGKGIKSSLLMSKASSLYSCLSKTNFSAAELLIQLNNEICETISRGMFVTMLIGIYDSNKKELLLSSAGHEPPIIFSKDGTFSNYNESGPPLGIMPKTKYTEHTIPFDNSSMYIFTDGITEIKNPKGEMLGSEGFQNYIQKYKDKPNNERLKIIIEDILNTGHIQKDDLTIVVIDGNN